MWFSLNFCIFSLFFSLLLELNIFSLCPFVYSMIFVLRYLWMLSSLFNFFVQDLQSLLPMKSANIHTHTHTHTCTHVHDIWFVNPSSLPRTFSLQRFHFNYFYKHLQCWIMLFLVYFILKIAINVPYYRWLAGDIKIKKV